MSVAATRWASEVLAADPSIPAGACRTVLYALATDADVETQRCFTGLPRLGAIAGVCAGHAAKAVHELESRGLIRVDRRRGTRNEYHLPVPSKLSTTTRTSARTSPARVRALVRGSTRTGARGVRAPVRAEGLGRVIEGGEAAWTPPTPEYLEAVAHLRARRLGEA